MTVNCRMATVNKFYPFISDKQTIMFNLANTHTYTEENFLTFAERVTSLWCPSPRHSTKATELPA